MATVTYNNAIENQFWLEIMGDNLRLLLTGLTPYERTESPRVKEYIKVFDNLLSRARQNHSREQLNQLNNDAFAATQNLRQYFLHILDLQLTKNFYVLLKPEYFNVMVNIAEQYLTILDAFMKNTQPQFDPTLQDIQWLPVFFMQASYIAENVGVIQNKILEKAEKYAYTFAIHYIFAGQLLEFRRIGKSGYPYEQQHRGRMEQLLRDYADFIGELMILVQTERIPGTISVEFIDSTNRMICYYLRKLATLSNTMQPECDPTSPRLIDTQ